MSGGAKSGFTILELVLVLAVTAALLVGLLAGTGTAIARQRYNDSVTSFRDFLQRQYSLVADVQNNSTDVDCRRTGTIESGFSISAGGPDTGGRGRSDCLIYGRLLEFGLTGIDAQNEIPGFNVGSNSGDIASFVRVTTIVGAMITLEDLELMGLAGTPGDGDIMQVDCITGERIDLIPDFNPLNRDVCVANFGSDTRAFSVAALTRLSDIQDQGAVTWYQLEQGASLVNPLFREPGGRTTDDRWHSISMSRSSAPYHRVPVHGAIFILRGPISGTVRTFIFDERNAGDFLTPQGIRPIPGGAFVAAGEARNFTQAVGASNGIFSISPTTGRFLHEEMLAAAQFQSKDFCIDSEDLSFFSGNRMNHRRMVTIAGGGSSSAAVEIMPLDLLDVELTGGRRHACRAL